MNKTKIERITAVDSNGRLLISTIDKRSQFFIDIDRSVIFSDEIFTHCDGLFLRINLINKIIFFDKKPEDTVKFNTITIVI